MMLLGGGVRLWGEKRGEGEGGEGGEEVKERIDAATVKSKPGESSLPDLATNPWAPLRQHNK